MCKMHVAHFADDELKKKIDSDLKVQIIDLLHIIVGVQDKITILNRKINVWAMDIAQIGEELVSNLYKSSTTIFKFEDEVELIAALFYTKDKTKKEINGYNRREAIIKHLKKHFIRFKSGTEKQQETHRFMAEEFILENI